MRVVYIGGYGRSGSSLLEIVLSAGEHAFGAGECGTLFRWWDDEAATCSCGEPYRRCSVWGPVGDHVLDRVGLDAAAAHQLTRRSQMRRSSDPRYGRLWRTVVDVLGEHTGAEVIVESTKTARAARFRPTRLQQAGLDVAPVHLVRDPAAVLASSARGRNAELGRGIERGRFVAVPAASWVAANAAMALQDDLAMIRPAAKVLYEDLATDPTGTVERLGKELDIDVRTALDTITSGAAFPAGHGVSGNRMRQAQGIVLRPPEPPAPVPPLRRPLVASLRWAGRRAGWLG